MIMTRINLLPWREELRQEQKKQFLTMLVMTAVLAWCTGCAWTIASAFGETDHSVM